jgi:hypothetical protein
VAKVQVNLGILRGVGKIDGAVTVGNGSSSGATILGGNSVSSGILTRNSALTFRSFSSYKCALNRASVKASQVSALGVIIDSGATVTFVDIGSGTLPAGTVFTVINNTSASPISGRFQEATGGNPGMVVVEVPPKPQWCEIRNMVLLGHERGSLFTLALLGS